MNRKIKTTLPILPSKLNNPVSTESKFEKLNKAKQKTANQFGKRHEVRELSSLKWRDSVWVIDIRTYGKVIEILEEPRSYIIATQSGFYRRNRWHLIPAPYYKFPSVTPALSKLTEPSYQSQLHVHNSEPSLNYDEAPQHPRNNGCDDQEVHSESDVNPHLNNSENSFSVEERPSRVVRKPYYLQDYITD
ncbi:unnamed protein product [Psylliodes chrysocephalus]|uniref:Uncharacterized protein n=1 Tax=Psylliodes chrysocephalus TaxID=3402493 RepID=A0A9P0CXI9_9CUCU|nr:unnamed protein product [Psylliodes chrysocephala]